MLKPISIFLCIGLFFLSGCFFKKTIKPDPNIKEGHLANGFSYFYLKNSFPKNHCYAILHVKAGSFAENDDELGMAHLIELLASAHARTSYNISINSHTSFEQSIYKIDLVSCDNLAQSLSILRSLAEGINIDELKLNQARKNIDEEEIEYKKNGGELSQKIIEHLYAGTLVAKRPITGQKEMRDRFSVQKVQDFYNKWYNPQNLSLVLVGDFDLNSVFVLINNAFKDLTKIKTANIYYPNSNVYEHKYPFFVVHDEEAQDNIQAAFNIQPSLTKKPAFSYELSKDRLAFDLALLMLSKRSKASIRGQMLDYSQYEFSLLLTTNKESFETDFIDAYKLLKEAMLHGFNQTEFLEAKKLMNEYLLQERLADQTFASENLVDKLLSHINKESIAMSTKDKVNLLEEILTKITIKDCSKALNNAINSGYESFFVTLNTQKHAISAEFLQSLLLNAKKQ